MRCVVDREEVRDRDVRVALRRGKRRMAEHLLDRAEISAAVVLRFKMLLSVTNIHTSSTPMTTASEGWSSGAPSSGPASQAGQSTATAPSTAHSVFTRGSTRDSGAAEKQVRAPAAPASSRVI